MRNLKEILSKILGWLEFPIIIFSYAVTVAFGLAVFWLMIMGIVFVIERLC